MLHAVEICIHNCTHSTLSQFCCTTPRKAPTSAARFAVCLYFKLVSYNHSQQSSESLIIHVFAKVFKVTTLSILGAEYDIGFGQKMFLSCNGSGFPTVLLDAPTGMNSDVWAILSSKLSSLTRVKSVTRTASLTLYCSNAEILAGCCMFRYAFMIEQALASVIAHSRYKARF